MKFTVVNIFICSIILFLGFSSQNESFKKRSLKQAEISTSVSIVGITDYPSPSAIPTPTFEPPPPPTEFLKLKNYPILVSGNAISPAPIKAKLPIEQRYLKENSINIENKSLREELNRKYFIAIYPQISGLINNEVENKINAELEEYANKVIQFGKNNQNALYRVELQNYITANYNNILCITFNTNFQIKDGAMLFESNSFIYELVNGQRLYLEDIFGKNIDYVKPLNNLVNMYFLESNSEETSLKRPFQGIRQDQAFNFDHENIFIILDSKNDEFMPNWVTSPYYSNIKKNIDKLPGIQDIYSRYLTSKKIYLNETSKVKLLKNNFNVSLVGKREVEPNKYIIEVAGLKFTNMGNQTVEKALNDWCNPIIPQEFKNNAISTATTAKNIMSIYRKEYRINANFLDYICITSNEEIRDANSIFNKFSIDSISYNIKSGKQLTLKDIFVDGFDYKKAIEDIIRINKSDYYKNFNLDDLSKILDNNPKFWFNDRNLTIRENLNTPSTSPSSERTISIEFSNLDEKNIKVISR